MDCGDALGGQEVVDQLRRMDVSQIDVLVLSHPHADHIGGMKAVLNRFPVKHVYDSGQNYKTKMYNDFRLQIEKEQIPFPLQCPEIWCNICQFWCY